MLLKQHAAQKNVKHFKFRAFACCHNSLKNPRQVDKITLSAFKNFLKKFQFGILSEDVTLVHLHLVSISHFMEYLSHSFTCPLLCYFSGMVVNAGFSKWDRLVVGGQFGQNDQKLHESYKINILKVTKLTMVAHLEKLINKSQLSNTSHISSTKLLSLQL